MAQTNVSTLPVVHEDLSDELAVINAAATLFTSTCPRGPAAENSEFKFAMDKHKPGRLGGLAEGTSVDRANVTNFLEDRKQHSGIVQEFREQYGVSKRVSVTMKPAGVTDAYNESEEKAMVTMKEDMELTFLSQQEAQTGSTSAAYLSWGISRTIDSGAQPNLPVDAAFRPSANNVLSKTAVTDITEADMSLMIQRLFESKKTGVDAKAFCTPDFATRFDSFFKEHSTAGSTVPVRSFQFAGGATMYEQAVTSYKTRFGKVDIIPTLLLNGVRGAASLAGAATVNTSTTVTVTSTAGLQKFMRIYGSGIPAGAHIVSITNATTFVISAAATATASPTLRLGELDHALFLDMSVLELKINQAPQSTDLSPDGSGQQGYLDAFTALCNRLPIVHGKINTAAA